MVDWTGDPELPVTRQAELLSLNRSSLYYQPVLPSAAELLIKRRIDEIYTQWPFYGSRKITVELNKEMLINRKAVQRHLREMGISALCPGPNPSKRQADQAIFPYLLRNVTAAYPNHVWGIDITYIRLQASWMYTGGRARLALALCAQLGTRSDTRDAFCVGDSGSRAGTGGAVDLEQRSGQPFHQPAIHRTPTAG